MLVTADDQDQALTRARVLEVRSRNAWQVEAIGGHPVPLADSMIRQWAGGMARTAGEAFPGYFAAMARREIALDDSVLS